MFSIFEALASFLRPFVDLFTGTRSGFFSLLKRLIYTVQRLASGLFRRSEPLTSIPGKLVNLSLSLRQSPRNGGTIAPNLDTNNLLIPREVHCRSELRLNG